MALWNSLTHLPYSPPARPRAPRDRWHRPDYRPAIAGTESLALTERWHAGSLTPAAAGEMLATEGGLYIRMSSDCPCWHGIGWHGIGWDEIETTQSLALRSLALRLRHEIAGTRNQIAAWHRDHWHGSLALDRCTLWKTHAIHLRKWRFSRDGKVRVSHSRLPCTV